MRRASHRSPFLVLPAAVMLLASCGSSQPPAARSAAESTTVTRAPSSMGAAVLAVANRVRAQGAVCNGQVMSTAPALTYNLALEDAAQLHAADMAAQDYFSHVSKDGRQLKDRILASGYAKSFIAAENIAAGYATAEEVVEAWLQSTSGHCEALMDPALRDVGIGYQESTTSKFTTYWVMDLATVR